MKTKEEMREYKKRWHEKNKKRISKKHKEYYKKNIERIKAMTKKWAKENEEKVKKYRIYNYKKNREDYIKRNKNWVIKNKEKSKEYHKNYMRELRKTKREKEMMKIRDYAYNHLKPILIKRYNGCKKCGSKNKLEIHHIKYTNKLEDVMILCIKCHKKIHLKIS